MADKKDKKDSVPEVIDLYLKKNRKVGHILRSRNEALSHAHGSGLEAVVKRLKDNGKGKSAEDIELDHLKSEEFQNVYAEAVVNSIVEKAKKELKLKDDHKFGDKADEQIYHDHILGLYAGMNRQGLQQLLKKYVSSAESIEDFHGGKLVEAVTGTKEYEAGVKKLQQSAANHVNESHKKDIFKYLGIDKFLDVDMVKDYLAPLNLANKKVQGEDITKEDIANFANIVGESYALKGEAKSHYEKLKKKGKKADELYKKAA
ncbi:MAG: hypothetical protein ACMXYF_03850 [Candidatus Woesearchaeota archaeon]